MQTNITGASGKVNYFEADLILTNHRIVFSTNREDINIAEIRVESGDGETRPKWLTTDPARSAFAPAYSPDGKHVAYFSVRQGLEREAIWVMDSDGSNPVPLIEDGRVNIFPRWAPDGQTVFYARFFPRFVPDSPGKSAAPPSRETLHKSCP